MKKGDKRKQRKAQDRRAARGRSTGRDRRGASVRQVLRRASGYPIMGCWTMANWEEVGLTPVLIARRQPDGLVAFGAYVVDLYCLGVKDTFCNVNYTRLRFYEEVLPRVFSGERPRKITPALAHELIYGSIEYAGQFGFRPQRDFRDSRYLLDPADAHPRSTSVEFGHKGKPLYVEGPYDNVQAILRQLARTAGEGNYNFMYSIDGQGPPPEDWDEWEEDDWEEEQAP